MIPEATICIRHHIFASSSRGTAKGRESDYRIQISEFSRAHGEPTGSPYPFLETEFCIMSSDVCAVAPGASHEQRHQLGISVPALDDEHPHARHEAEPPRAGRTGVDDQASSGPHDQLPMGMAVDDDFVRVGRK
jgi:hypothetical protein